MITTAKHRHQCKFCFRYCSFAKVASNGTSCYIYQSRSNPKHSRAIHQLSRYTLSCVTDNNALAPLFVYLLIMQWYTVQFGQRRCCPQVGGDRAVEKVPRKISDMQTTKDKSQQRCGVVETLFWPYCGEEYLSRAILIRYTKANPHSCDYTVSSQSTPPFFMSGTKSVSQARTERSERFPESGV